MTFLTAWVILSIGCSIGFVAGTLFSCQRNERADGIGARMDERHASSEASTV